MTGMTPEAASKAMTAVIDAQRMDAPGAPRVRFQPASEVRSALAREAEAQGLADHAASLREGRTVVPERWLGDFFRLLYQTGHFE